jgi:hypothetical protein
MRCSRLGIIALGAMAAVTMGGCGTAGKGIGSSGAEIQGGAADLADPAVGLLYIGGIQGSAPAFCTATLIDSSVILTAAHCILSPDATFTFYTGAGQPGPIATFGPSAVAGMVAHAIDDAPVVHPSFTTQVCPDTSHDIALLHLNAPLDGVTPVPWSTAPEPAVGTTCTAVGFGADYDGSADLYGQKRSATEIIAEVLTDSPNVSVSAGTGIADSGDSGGPLLYDGVIVGTTSCHHPDHAVEYYSRIDDGVANWIQSQVNVWDGTGSGNDGGSRDDSADGGDDGGDGGDADAN